MVTPTVKILVVESELVLSDLLTYTLLHAGFTVIQALDGASALDEFAREQPDLVIMALNLPDLDGLEVIKRMRLESEVPIIVLTVRHADDDVVASLEAGADEYVTKPFSARQLVARVQAVIRRAAGKAENMYHVGALSLNVESNEACWQDGSLIHLTPLETRLLRALMRTPDRVLIAEGLMMQVWGSGGATREMLKQLIYRLRKKIEPDPESLPLIETVRDIGYKLNTPEDDPNPPDAEQPIR
jgi:DNA-binding response OmpR family regulator